MARYSVFITSASAAPRLQACARCYP
jgi:hypothetical protein